MGLSREWLVTLVVPSTGTDWAVVAGTVAAVLGITREVGTYVRAKQASAAAEARRDDSIGGRPSLQAQLEALAEKVREGARADQRLLMERRKNQLGDSQRLWAAIGKLQEQDSTRNSRLQAITGELELRLGLQERAQEHLAAALDRLAARLDQLERDDREAHIRSKQA